MSTQGWLIIAAATTAIVAAQGNTSSWDGVYSEAQAGRGKKSYITHCACVPSRGTAGRRSRARALKGEEFLLRWNDKSMFEFVDRVQTTMPQDIPAV